VDHQGNERRWPIHVSLINMGLFSQADLLSISTTDTNLIWGLSNGEGNTPVSHRTSETEAVSLFIDFL
jgi:hypothetical protein